MKTRIMLFVLFFSISINGCAVISNGTSQKVSLTTSNGKSLLADIDGRKVMLPAEIKISRNKGATIKVLNADNPDYEDVQLIINGNDEISSLFWLDFVGGFFSLLPGATSTAVDYATGGMYKYANPNFVVFVREKS